MKFVPENSPHGIPPRNGSSVVIPQSFRLQTQLQLANLGSSHKWGECAKTCARRIACLFSRSSGGVSILADPFVLE